MDSSSFFKVVSFNPGTLRASNVSHTVVLRPLKAGYFNFTSASVSYLAQEGGQVVVKTSWLSWWIKSVKVFSEVKEADVFSPCRLATPVPLAREASWLRGSSTGASPHTMWVVFNSKFVFSLAHSGLHWPAGSAIDLRCSWFAIVYRWVPSKHLKY